jgi:hypothetical protein
MRREGERETTGTSLNFPNAREMKVRRVQADGRFESV